MSQAIGHKPVRPLSNKTIRVLIIHEHAIIREGLRLLLEHRTNYKIVGEANTCFEALDMLAGERPDIVLLDTDLRAPNSIDALSNLMLVSPETRLLILTGVNEPELCQRAIQSGAAGLFIKDQRCDVLIKAIEKVLDGEVWMDRSLMAAVLVNLRRTASDEDEEKEKISSVTNREREIISLVCEGLRNREIAGRLFIGEKTVRNHMASIFSKLNVAHRLKLSVYAHKHGLEAYHSNSSATKVWTTNLPS